MYRYTVISRRQLLHNSHSNLHWTTVRHLIQRFKNYISVFFENAQRDLIHSPWLVYSIGFFLFLNAGNAFCKDSPENWDKISGPIPIVNQSPIQLLFLQAIPDRAETLPEDRYSLRFNVATTNTLLWEKSEDYYGYIDMEMIRSSLELEYGILSGVELGISLPFIYTYPGFMDHFIFEFENLFNDTRSLRKKENQRKSANNFTYLVKKNNLPFIAGKKRSSGIGDLILRVKQKIWNEGDRLPCLSIRLAVKIPTGDEDKAFGSGKVDYGFGLLLQKGIKRVTAYLNADVIFPGEAFDQQNISLSSFYEIMLGAEYKVSSRFSTLTQINYITRPFENTGIEMLDRRMWNILLGVNYVTEGRVFIQGGAIEDILGAANAGSDITFFLNVGENF